MRAGLKLILLLGYCVSILLLLDFVYSNFFYSEAPIVMRRSDPDLHHSSVPNFNGFDLWLGRFYRVRTNSLGFKDAAVGDVPLSTQHRRILLVGDSFTEGLGLPFEQTFAGLMSQAGRSLPQPIDVLDAGATSYSPTLYYRLVKMLLARGLRVDEVVVFSDMSDVRDEASSYFCFDEDPYYLSLCDEAKERPFAEPRSPPTWLQRNFAVIDGTLRLIKLLLWVRRNTQPPPLSDPASIVPGIEWAFWREGDPPIYPPLGVEGGIERSLKNMQALADLLASRGIALTIVVYPWPAHLARDDANNRQVSIWSDFCRRNCRDFINLFPVFSAEKAAGPDWYRRLFQPGDVHYSAEGNRVVFRSVWNRLLR